MRESVKRRFLFAHGEFFTTKMINVSRSGWSATHSYAHTIPLTLTSNIRVNPTKEK